MNLIILYKLFAKIFEVKIGGHICDSCIVMLNAQFNFLFFGLFAIFVEWIALVFTSHMSYCIV